MGKRYREYEQGQSQLFPPRVGDLIDEDDDVRAFSEIIDRLDLEPFHLNYKTSGVTSGAPAYHARMMIKLVFWCYAHGVRSSRRIADFARFDVRGMWLCGEQRPRHSTICEFRTRHGLDTIQHLFVQILQIAAGLGIDACGTWAIDGTRIRANAGTPSLATAEALAADRDRLRAEIAAALHEAERLDAAEDAEDDRDSLPPGLRRKEDRATRIDQALARLQQVEEQSRSPRKTPRTASATDPDAPTMKRTDVGAAPAYNAQATVDADSQLIVAADVSQAHTDYDELLPQLDQALANTGAKPAAVVADAGYASGLNFAGLEKRDVTGFVSQRREADSRAGFVYDESSNSFTCPAGRQLVFDRRERQTKRAGSYSRTVYRCVDCSGCAQAAACKRPDVGRRTVRVSEHDQLQRTMRERMASPEGRSAYVRRKSSVETVFAILKSALGFRRFHLRGLSAARCEWTLLCAAFNIRKLIQAV